MLVRLLSWNIKNLPLWDRIAAEDVDVALLQEVPQPPREGVDAYPLEMLPGAGERWITAGWEKRSWRTAIARVSPDIQLQPLTTCDIGGPDWEALRVSRSGTLTAANVIVDGRPAFTAVSVYAPWERPLGCEKPIWADGSAHRLLSDLSPLLCGQRRRPVIVAGDWNILYGYGEHGDPHYAHRYKNVFDRAQALGLQFVGPCYPNGRQADPWPDELPGESRCVPTYHHNRQTPETATRQLDFVFASSSIADRVQTGALNDPGAWGPSDHCRIKIEVDVSSRATT